MNIICGVEEGLRKVNDAAAVSTVCSKVAGVFSLYLSWMFSLYDMTKLFAHKSTANPPTQTDTFTLVLIIFSTRNLQLLRHYMTELTHTTPSQQMHDTNPPMFCLFYNSTVSSPALLPHPQGQTTEYNTAS